MLETFVALVVVEQVQGQNGEKRDQRYAGKRAQDSPPGESPRDAACLSLGPLEALDWASDLAPVKIVGFRERHFGLIALENGLGDPQLVHDSLGFFVPADELCNLTSFTLGQLAIQPSLHL